MSSFRLSLNDSSKSSTNPLQKAISSKITAAQSPSAARLLRPATLAMEGCSGSACRGEKGTPVPTACLPGKGSKPSRRGRKAQHSHGGGDGRLRYPHPAGLCLRACAALRRMRALRRKRSGILRVLAPSVAYRSVGTRHGGASCADRVQRAGGASCEGGAARGAVGPLPPVERRVRVLSEGARGAPGSPIEVGCVRSFTFCSERTCVLVVDEIRGKSCVSIAWKNGKLWMAGLCILPCVFKTLDSEQVCKTGTLSQP